MTYDVCVIGGGISGASFAHHCAQDGARTLIIEASDGCGCIASHSIDNGAHIELGAHGMTNRYKEVISLIEAVQLEDAVLASAPLKLKLRANGAFHKPTQKIHWPTLAASLPRSLWISKADQSLATYYSAIMGTKNYSQLLRPAFRAVLSQNPDHFPAELLFKKRSSRKDWPKKFTLQGGFERLVHALREHKNIELKTNTRVTKIEQVGAGYKITTQSGEEFQSNSIALATPAQTAAQLIKQVAPDVSTALSQIKSTKIQTVLAHTKASNRPMHGAFFEEDDIFSMIHMADHYYVFHTRDTDTPIQISKLAEILDVNESSVKIVSRREAELPVITSTSRNLSLQLKHSPVFLPCNYINGLSLEDCCLQSAQEFARWKQLHQ